MTVQVLDWASYQNKGRFFGDQAREILSAAGAPTTQDAVMEVLQDMIPVYFAQLNQYAEALSSKNLLSSRDLRRWSRVVDGNGPDVIDEAYYALVGLRAFEGTVLPAKMDEWMQEHFDQHVPITLSNYLPPYQLASNVVVWPVDGEDHGPGGVLVPFASENQHLREAFQHPLYGEIPDVCRVGLPQLPLVPEERVMAAVRTEMGMTEQMESVPIGYVVLTTHFLRYIEARSPRGTPQGEALSLAQSERWPLSTPVGAAGTLLSKTSGLRSGATAKQQGQVLGLSPLTQQFCDLYRLVQLSLQ